MSHIEILLKMIHVETCDMKWWATKHIEIGPVSGNLDEVRNMMYFQLIHECIIGDNRTTT